jgi:hypothetical protein
VFHRSMSRLRFGLASAAIVALLVLSTGSVAADTTPGGDGTFTQNGKTADAYSSDCSSNGDGTTTCSDVGLSIFAGKMSDSFSGVTHANQVCVSIGSFTYDDETGESLADFYESGCQVDLAKGTIQFGKGLSSATLATTTISIAQWICNEETCEPGPSRDVTVVGTWTGVGPTFSSKSRSSGDDGTCRYSDSGKGSSREASFAGTIDGQSLSGDSYASITDGKFTYRSRCSEV